MYTIFSIDNWSDLHTMAKFLRHVDTLRAMNKLKSEVKQGIGMYQGTPEPCWLMRTEDMHLVSEYTKDQEAFLEVPFKAKDQTILRYRDGSSMRLGVLKCSIEPPLTDNWTYMDNKYWSIKNV